MLIEVQGKERNISDIDSNDDEKLLGFVLLKRTSNAARQRVVHLPKRVYSSELKVSLCLIIMVL